jgi:hypothetical protein
MAELVGDHALHLVRIVGGGDEARMDVDDLPAGNEGVDALVVDEDDLHVFGPEPRRCHDRTGHVAEQHLRFRIAKDRLGGGRLRQSGEAQGDQHRQTREESADAAARSGNFSHRAGYPVSAMNGG